MSTVTTHLCRYEGEALANKQRAMQKARAAQWEQAQQRKAEMLTKLETWVAEGVDAQVICDKLEFSKQYILRRTLYREGRPDLAKYFADNRPARKPKARYKCAIGGCRGVAMWIEDAGLDPDDEPIAEWSYLCKVCQGFEDLCEDVEFLLDPKRGRETSVFRICARVGYGGSQMGLEALRQRLKNHGRVDLRDALDIESVKGQRGWYLQGSLHTSSATYWTRNADFVLAANGLERAVHNYGMLA